MWLSSIFLLISGIFFIATYGIHMMITFGDMPFKPAYTRYRILSFLPWISGFILPVIPFVIVFNLNWLIIFFINIAAVLILGRILTRGFLSLFASVRGLGIDIGFAFIAGLITFIIGLILKVLF
jgi:hypothetical protein